MITGLGGSLAGMESSGWTVESEDHDKRPNHITQFKFYRTAVANVRVISLSLLLGMNG